MRNVATSELSAGAALRSAIIARTIKKRQEAYNVDLVRGEPGNNATWRFAIKLDNEEDEPPSRHDDHLGYRRIEKWNPTVVPAGMVCPHAKYVVPRSL